jgi:hypothetical protein
MADRKNRTRAMPPRVLAWRPRQDQVAHGTRSFRNWIPARKARRGASRSVHGRHRPGGSTALAAPVIFVLRVRVGLVERQGGGWRGDEERRKRRPVWRGCSCRAAHCRESAARRDRRHHQEHQDRKQPTLTPVVLSRCSQRPRTARTNAERPGEDIPGPRSSIRRPAAGRRNS